MRLSSKAQIRGHGKERQEEDEIKDYVDELDACITDTWFVAERATIFDRPHFEALLTQGISMRRQGTIDGLILGSVDRLTGCPETRSMAEQYAETRLGPDSGYSSPRIGLMLSEKRIKSI